MAPRTKERRMEPVEKRGRFTTAMVLVAGLALLSGCKNEVPAQKPMTEQRSPARKDVAKIDCKTISATVPKVNAFVSMKQGNCIVREGNELTRVEAFTKIPSTLTFSVGKIDNEGVEVRFSIKIFGSKQGTIRSAPSKVGLIGYGDTKTPISWGKEFPETWCELRGVQLPAPQSWISDKADRKPSDFFIFPNNLASNPSEDGFLPLAFS
jgi:hypothetical protein